MCFIICRQILNYVISLFFSFRMCMALVHFLFFLMEQKWITSKSHLKAVCNTNDIIYEPKCIRRERKKEVQCTLFISQSLLNAKYNWRIKKKKWIVLMLICVESCPDYFDCDVCFKLYNFSSSIICCLCLSYSILRLGYNSYNEYKEVYSKTFI